LRDSPAACATLGVNLFRTKMAVFMISAAIAGFAGALLGIARGTASTMDFAMLQGLPFLLLLVVGGASVVSGALVGGILLQVFTWLTVLLPNGLKIPVIGIDAVALQSKIGPGLAGIGIGRNPEGAVTEVSIAWQEKFPDKGDSAPPPTSVAAAGQEA